MKDIEKIKAEYELKIREAEMGNALETELDMEGVRLWVSLNCSKSVKGDYPIVFVCGPDTYSRLTARQVGEILTKFEPDEEYPEERNYPVLPYRISIDNNFQGSEILIEYIRKGMRIRISDIQIMPGVPEIDQYFKTYYRDLTEIERDTYGRRAAEIDYLLAFNFKSPNVVNYYGGHKALVCAQEAMDIVNAFKKHYEEERQTEA